MTVGDLIKKRDYDYIEWRVRCQDTQGNFTSERNNLDTFLWGICESKNGELLPFDSEHYELRTEVADYAEWSKLEGDNVTNALTIVTELEPDL